MPDLSTQRAPRLRPPGLSWAIALLAVVAIGGCGEAPGLGVDGGSEADAAPVAQGGPAVGDLVINEVAPIPATGADWVELLNRSGEALELSDFFLTDAADRLDHYQPLSGSLGSGEVVVVETTAFGLGRAEEVHIVTTTGIVVDGLSYLMLGVQQETTLARLPHGEGPFYLSVPSPGEPNP